MEHVKAGQAQHVVWGDWVLADMTNRRLVIGILQPRNVCPNMTGCVFRTDASLTHGLLVREAEEVGDVHAFAQPHPR